jgi:hypothetical protein
MNIKYKFSAKYLFFIGAFLLILIVFTYRFSIREGQTSGGESEDKCNPIANVLKGQNDEIIGELISDHVKNSSFALDSYLPQLQAIQEKFRNVSSCLSIGTIDISSENSFPVVTIDDPVPGTIKQTINYILPRGQTGDKGDVGKSVGADGLSGKKGPNGARGPIGQNIIPTNINKKIY